MTEISMTSETRNQTANRVCNVIFGDMLRRSQPACLGRQRKNGVAGADGTYHSALNVRALHGGDDLFNICIRIEHVFRRNAKRAADGVDPWV